MGFTKPVVNRSMRELIKLGWITEKRNGPGERPFRVIHPGPRSQEKNAGGSDAKVLHHRHIDQLLVWGEQALHERSHQLTINKRVVLLCLLAMADESGLVRGMGLPALSRFTGLPVPQVRNNIKLLTRHHYIASSVPGGNFPGTMGKATSTYLLNLRHPNFEHEAASGATCLITCSRSSYGYARHEAASFCISIASLRKKIRRAKISKNQKLLDEINNDPLRPLAEYRRLKITSGLANRMQWELQDIASIALNRPTNEDASPNVDKLIRERLLKEIIKDSALTEEERTEVLTPTLYFISELITSIVRRTRRILEQLPLKFSESTILQLFPKNRQDPSNETSTIEILNCSASTEGYQVLDIHIDFESSSVLGKAQEVDLHELSQNTLHRYSLATLPLEPPRLRSPPRRKKKRRPV